MSLLKSIVKCKPKTFLWGIKHIHDFIPKGKTYINGKWISAKDGKDFPVFNPANGEKVGSVPDCSCADVETAIEGSYDSFKTWSNLTAKERSSVLRKLFGLQMEHKDYLARLITLEVGKNLKESEDEIAYGASYFEWFSEEARRIYGDIVPSPFKNKQPFLVKQPIGVAGIITPMLLKNSASTVKRVSLELGGNAPFIVFDSAKIPLAVSGLIASKFRNSGQTCVCTNRILVQESVYEQFIHELTRCMQEQLKVGDGFDQNVNIGPLINDKAILKVQDHVRDAVKKRANLVLGGKIHSCGKQFYEPTLLTNIQKKMHLCSEETFGPVAAIMKFKTEEEAINVVNSTRSGLAGYFYSEDVSQIQRVAKLLEVGMIGVNDGMISMAEIPFGGVKESGVGHEGSRYGIDEYITIKYICLGGLT